MQFIVKYRVSHAALETLFGALKRAETEGIEFLGCFPEEEKEPPVAPPRHLLNGKARARTTKSWPKRHEWALRYKNRLLHAMVPEKTYTITDVKALEADIVLFSEKHPDQPLAGATLAELIRALSRDGYIAKTGDNTYKKI